MSYSVIATSSLNLETLVHCYNVVYVSIFYVLHYILLIVFHIVFIQNNGSTTLERVINFRAKCKSSYQIFLQLFCLYSQCSELLYHKLQFADIKVGKKVINKLWE